MTAMFSTKPDLAYASPKTGEFIQGMRVTDEETRELVVRVLAGRVQQDSVGQINQNDLIELRMKAGVHELLQGLTGWAQINGRDKVPIPEKVNLDGESLQRQSLRFDVCIPWTTFVRVPRRDGVFHL